MRFRSSSANNSVSARVRHHLAVRELKKSGGKDFGIGGWREVAGPPALVHCKMHESSRSFVTGKRVRYHRNKVAVGIVTDRQGHIVVNRKGRDEVDPFLKFVPA